MPHRQPGKALQPKVCLTCLDSCLHQPAHDMNPEGGWVSSGAVALRARYKTLQHQIFPRGHPT